MRTQVVENKRLAFTRPIVAQFVLSIVYPNLVPKRLERPSQKPLPLSGDLRDDIAAIVIDIRKTDDKLEKLTATQLTNSQRYKTERIALNP